MQFTKCATYPFLAHAQDGFDLWDPHFLENSTHFAAPLMKSTVSAAMSLQIYDLKEMAQLEASHDQADDRPYRVDQGSTFPSGLRTAVMQIPNTPIYVVTRFDSTSWYLYYVDTQFEAGILRSPSFTGVNAACLSQHISADTFLVGRWDTSTIEGYHYDTDITNRVDNGGIDYTIGGTGRAGCLCVVGDLLFAPLVSVTGVSTAPRAWTNQVCMFAMNLEQPNQLELLQMIDVSSICTDGNGCSALLYKGGFYYFFESGCGAYAGTPPFPGNSPVHMHIARLDE